LENISYLEQFAVYDRFHDLNDDGINIAQPDIAQIITKILLENNSYLYEILYSCIMHNHVHLVLDTSIDIDPSNLSSILKTIKGRSSREINLCLKRTGTF